ncbi:MAG: sigma-54-dependent Fis family transcriptional regulator [Bryobacterales bacterium]|nr:sigma-54-dependent Fis family transcriptional regulator [Bryobacterales bacterium]
MPRLVIVDDEANIRLSLRLILEREGYQVAEAGSVAEFAALSAPLADAYLVDVRLPDGTGVDVLRRIRESSADVPVVMISGQATIADAVAATRLGAFDFLEKPLARDKVLLTLRHAVEQTRLRAENDRLREQVGGEARMVGSSPAWREAVEQATLAARSDARVLLLGESGTGKELLAEHVHRASPFAAGPFVKVNCAAIPTELLESELFGHEKGAFTGANAARRGKFELADGGSLFLDEVGDLPLAAQAKLLRVLQEGEFHRVGGEKPIRTAVRVIAATNRDLHQMATSGPQPAFREDLYYRLCVMPIRLPALRERRGDIRAMAGYFLDEFCRRNNFRAKSLGDEVMEALEAYGWPGNERELRNIVERMAILSPGDEISLAALPLELRVPATAASKSSVYEARNDAERDHLLRALEQTGWNVAAAARIVGLERTNLHKRMRALGLERGR